MTTTKCYEKKDIQKFYSSGFEGIDKEWKDGKFIDAGVTCIFSNEDCKENFALQLVDNIGKDYFNSSITILDSVMKMKYSDISTVLECDDKYREDWIRIRQLNDENVLSSTFSDILNSYTLMKNIPKSNRHPQFFIFNVSDAYSRIKAPDGTISFSSAVIANKQLFDFLKEYYNKLKEAEIFLILLFDIEILKNKREKPLSFIFLNENETLKGGGGGSAVFFANNIIRIDNYHDDKYTFNMYSKDKSIYNKATLSFNGNNFSDISPEEIVKNKLDKCLKNK